MGKLLLTPHKNNVFPRFSCTGDLLGIQEFCGTCGMENFGDSYSLQLLGVQAFSGVRGLEVFQV